MDNRSPSRRRLQHAAAGFSLVELLVVLAIVGMLAALIAPAIGKVRDRAETTKSANNLRNIGVAVLAYVSDHDNRFPIIETDPTNPVYDPEDEAGTMLSVLGPYGVSERTLRCPLDVRTFNNFAKKGSSYEWRPMMDGELANNPVIFTRRGERTVPSSRVRLVTDFEPVHAGKKNHLFADGRVILR